MIDSKDKSERVLLIGINLPSYKKYDVIESFAELELLAKSANATVVQKIIQIRKEIDTKYFLGKGKIEELKEIIATERIDTIIFDNELSPVQVRNIEEVLNCKAIGRIELILDIFATRARTREAKLQVEYAQLSYLMPRLTKRWGHLSRIEGGIGLRGPGETQLEIDRRLVKKRISNIKNELKKIDIQMANRRKRRADQKIISLVGYTNSGKSTLLNLLAKEQLFTQDLLFATLDPAVRKVFISDKLQVLMIDTVGFIRNLPHQLIVSFKSTLDEVLQASLLLHVIDVSSECINDRISAVNNVLFELSALNKTMVYLFNKTDLVKDNVGLFQLLKEKYPSSCFISAKDNTGIEDLKLLIEEYFNV